MARVDATERRFVWKLAVIMAVGVLFASLGVWKVRQRSAGVRTAYKLAHLHDQLREQVELNRRHQAALAGKKDPNRLRREALGSIGMRTPGLDETREVD
jgi:hypothetical protein